MNKETIIVKLTGYILLIPALLSVLLFIAKLLDIGTPISTFSFTAWSGYYNANLGGGYTSALPLYFGLMAIAGAYLIKDNKS